MPICLKCRRIICVDSKLAVTLVIEVNLKVLMAKGGLDPDKRLAGMGPGA
jgi:hypothetical protein